MRQGRKDAESLLGAMPQAASIASGSAACVAESIPIPTSTRASSGTGFWRQRRARQGPSFAEEEPKI